MEFFFFVNKHIYVHSQCFSPQHIVSNKHAECISILIKLVLKLYNHFWDAPIVDVIITLIIGVKPAAMWKKETMLFQFPVTHLVIIYFSLWGNFEISEFK